MKNVKTRIKKIEEKKRKNTFIRKLIFFLIIFITILLLSMRYIGTSFINIRDYELEYENINSFVENLKVVHFSDLNYGHTTDINKIKDLVEKINLLKPDLIIFTGDLSYKNISEYERKEIIKELSKLNSKYGKYFVNGSKDDNKDIEILKKAKFTRLENNYDYVLNEKQEKLIVAGIDYDKNIDKLKNDLKEKKEFIILLSHMPDYYLDFKKGNHVDLLLSGRTKGGFIRLPKTECFIKLKGAKNYCKNYYKEKDTYILVSNGIGTSKFPFRLFNLPSINLIRFKKKS